MTRVDGEGSSAFSSWRFLGWILCVVLLLSDQWMLGPALFTLLLGWHLLSKTSGPLVMPAAFAYQWLQVSIAPLYVLLTGRLIIDMNGLDYGSMFATGLIAVASYFGGYWLITRPGNHALEEQTLGKRGSATTTAVFVSYVVAFVLTLFIHRNAWSFPAITQILYMLGFARYGLLFVLISRLANPRPQWLLIGAVVLFEVAVGFTAFFAGFREPLLFIGLALTTSLRTRRTSTWLALIFGALFAVATVITWTAVKPVVRADYGYASSTADRLKRVISLIGPAMRDPATGTKAQVDRVVSRLWMLRFPSLALARVPAEVPHERGRLLRNAVTNAVVPRAVFPNKPILPSESEKVRLYSGVNVAGRERGTSFAFGYVAESYVDFGKPLMFLPIFAFGCLLGFGDRLMRRVLNDPDVLNAVRVVVLWSSAYAFEQSWSMMVGTAVSLFVVMMLVGIATDRLLARGAGPSRGLRISPGGGARASRPA